MLNDATLLTSPYTALIVFKSMDIEFATAVVNISVPEHRQHCDRRNSQGNKHSFVRGFLHPRQQFQTSDTPTVPFREKSNRAPSAMENGITCVSSSKYWQVSADSLP
jgi:hypothetical protein